MIGRIGRLGIALAALVQLSSGCTYYPVRLTTSESARYDPSRSRDISARACGFMWGGVIPIALSSRDQRAFRRLRELAQGEYIADVEVEEEMTYAVVGFVMCTTFHAVAYPRL